MNDITDKDEIRINELIEIIEARQSGSVDDVISAIVELTELNKKYED
jgi:hypothetical protein